MPNHPPKVAHQRIDVPWAQALCSLVHKARRTQIRFNKLEASWATSKCLALVPKVLALRPNESRCWTCSSLTSYCRNSKTFSISSGASWCLHSTSSKYTKKSTWSSGSWKSALTRPRCFLWSNYKSSLWIWVLFKWSTTCPIWIWFHRPRRIGLTCSWDQPRKN